MFLSSHTHKHRHKLNKCEKSFKRFKIIYVINSVPRVYYGRGEGGFIMEMSDKQSLSQVMKENREKYVTLALNVPNMSSG